MSEPYAPKSDADLENLAQDIVGGLVWSFYNEDAIDSFLVIHLMDQARHDWMKANDITFAYEYLDKAGPFALVNGRPLFMSVNFLNRVDAEKLHQRVRANARFQEDRLKAAGAGEAP